MISLLQIIYPKLHQLINQYQIQQLMKKEDLRKRLTQEQWRVTQLNATQSPYENQYYLTKQQGMYHCIVCDVPLFSSQKKFDSGCGWPAFSDELQGANLKKINVNGLLKGKIEVRCNNCDAHLGHVFQRGPKENTSNRYCINSASMNFYKK